MAAMSVCLLPHSSRAQYGNYALLASQPNINTPEMFASNIHYVTNHYANMLNARSQGKGQSTFFFQLNANSENIWGWLISDAINIGSLFLGGSAFEFPLKTKYIVEYNGENIVNNDDRPYRWPIKNLTHYKDKKDFFKHKYGFDHIFRNAEFASKFGWNSPYSMFIPYVSIKYCLDGFYTNFPGEEDKNENTMRSYAPGIGLQLIPLRDKAFAPFVEVATEHETYTKCSTYCGSDLKQLQNGINMRYAIGFKTLGTASKNGRTRTVDAVIAYALTRSEHNIFNPDYTPDGVSYPYKDITSKKVNHQLVVYFYL